MQLLKSLFCWRGFDNRIRFSLIQAGIYLGFIFSSITFSIIPATICLVFLFVIHLCSAQRRISDSQLKQHWLITLSVTYLLSTILILAIDSSLIYLILLIPIAISLLLLTYPERPAKKYILGYNGSVDLSEYLHTNQSNISHTKRIEPTLVGQQVNTVENIFDDSHDASKPYVDNPPHHNNNEKADIGETIRLAFQSNTKLVITFLGIISFVITVLMILLSQEGPSTGKLTMPVKQAAEKVRLHPVTLPDNFTVLLSEHQGVIINWRAEQTDNGNYWTLETAQGDSNCESVVFNDGDKIRTMTVIVESGTEYFAQFSPLDTQQIIKNIAFRGHFSLCGYTFSLKGSQAVLGKNKVYAEFIEY